MVEYYSFDDVLNELQLQEEELKRMVSEGELRAYRDENKMKFRKDDVESIKKTRVTEPTVVLPPSAPSVENAAPPAPAATVEETGELLLTPEPAGEILEPAAASGELDLAPAAAPTPAADAGETVAGETTGITEQMVFEDTDLTVAADETAGTAIESQETFVDEEEAVRTEPLQIAEEKTVGEEEEAAAPRARAARRGMAIATAAPPKAESHPILNIILFVGIVVLALAFCVGLDTSRIAREKADPDRATNLTKEVSKIFADILVDPNKLPPK